MGRAGSLGWLNPIPVGFLTVGSHTAAQAAVQSAPRCAAFRFEPSPHLGPQFLECMHHLPYHPAGRGGTPGPMPHRPPGQHPWGGGAYPLAP